MASDLIDILQRFTAPLARRVANMIARATVKKSDDDKHIQELQLEVLDSEVRDGVEHFQNYGFTSVPLEGAEAVVIFVGGRRDHGLAIATGDRRYRLRSLSSGEVAVYNHTGAHIVFKANGDIELNPKAGQAVKIAADVEVTGTLTASADVVADGVSLKTHTHGAGTLTYVNAGGSPTTVTGATGGPT